MFGSAPNMLLIHRAMILFDMCFFRNGEEVQNKNLDKRFLVNYEEKSLQRGKVLLCRDDSNDLIALMISEVVGENTYNLMVISGYKAGLNYCCLPIQAVHKESGFGIDTKWLVENWNHYGYQGSSIENVSVSDEIDANILM